eukprot:373898_1
MAEESKHENLDNDIKNILSNLYVLELYIGYNANTEEKDNVSSTKANKSKWRKPTDILVDYSIFDSIEQNTKQTLINKASSTNIHIDRSIGCMVGMGIGDAVGAPLEFQAIDIKDHDNRRPKFVLKEKQWIHTKNKFRLSHGQWTDDSAMGLCIADSLLIHKQFNASDIRLRFWNWWFNGYNNAFHNDRDERGSKSFCEQHNLTFMGLTSIGLGKNISNSLFKLEWKVPPSDAYVPKLDSEDSGNGSLIRLAPIPIHYQYNMKEALQYTELSSFTTHPGYHASEACKLLCFIIVNAIQRDANHQENIKTFLDDVTRQYLTSILEEEIEELVSELSKNDDKESVNALGVSCNKSKRKLNAKMLTKRLIESNEKVSSKEVCWNWRCKVKAFRENLVLGMNTRKWGYKEENKESDDDYPDLYNNYPVESEYFGAYCVDGLAMALNAVYNSTCFGDAVENAVNALGDADSTGSIAGQIAGAFYGYKSIVEDECQSFLVDQLTQWDDYNFALYGILLHCAGNRDHASNK